MEASIAIQVVPNVDGEEKMISVVDKVIEYISSTGLNYQVGAFETSIEGDFDELMEVAKQCQLVAIKAGTPSVSTNIKVVYKPEGDVLSIEKKTKKHQH
ncbi:thiamine-binding protein [Companilactobacillus insicii]|uniref:thiamine-binding protein n=1 Tax=Companilactobacillus insicii TaxID=1732567 RepID=UPI000F789394|nr:thiamine-binding protein [Companilactobacillus insicii]